VILAPGSRLGPYEILERIGAGGMGEVWKARDTRLGRTVAIKKVKEQHSERFKQETRSIAALNHPNICQLFDIGSDYLVLEYVEGKSLSSPLPENEAVRLAIQIATALEAAHKKNIIHRDLKPGNIMVTGEGSVKLLDFGLAKLYEQDAGGVPPATSTLPTADFPATQAGTVLGTLAYMSPEQAQGRPADARSDIFSFGLVLYEMLSGRRAFSGESNPAIMAALLRDDPPPLQTSPALEKIVRSCLAKQPSGRYQTASEAKTALEQIFSGKVTASSTESQPSIAVLPFADMSPGKDNEWFGDGLAEEIINALTQIPGLLVIARTSAFAFKGRNEDIRKIAETLGVTNILEGSVRKAGNRIRVTAQLIDASRGVHLWSQRYDRDLTDVFAIQDEISAAIAEALQLKLSGVSPAFRRHEPNAAAHEAYLKARYHHGKLKPETLALCRECLEQAIALDPDYSLPYCGLAEHFFTLANSTGGMPAHEAMPLARKMAWKALEIDESLPEAHGLLGIVAAAYDYDWKEAERQFRLAMALDPFPPHVRHWYAFMYLYPMGRIAESIEQQEEALKGDPLDIIAIVALAWSLFIAGRPADAQRKAYKILEFEENNSWASYFMALIYAREDKWSEALDVAEKGFPLIPPLHGTLAGILKRVGKLERAEELMRKIMPGDSYSAPLALFHYYFLSGETDKAMDWLERTIAQRHPLAFIFLSLVRSSPRRPALAGLMNLPENVS